MLPLATAVSCASSLVVAGPAAPWRRAACALALCGALSAAAAGEALSGAASAARGALTAELAALKFDSRAHPDASLPRLAALIPRLAGEPALQIEGLLALGMNQAVVADGPGIERTIAELRALGQAAGQASAAVWASVAAETVRADWMRRQGPVGRASRLLSDAVASLPAEVPPALRLRFTLSLGTLKEQEGKYDDAVRQYQQAIALADAMAEPAWRRAELRSALAYVLHLAGHGERARPISQQALEMARSANDDEALFQAYTTEGILLSAGDNDHEVQLAMQAALHHARHAGAARDEVLATANLADLYLRRGDYGQALAFAERALPLARQLHNQSAESVALTNIGLAQIMLGRKDEGLHNTRAALAIEEQTGALATAIDDLDETGGYLERAGFLSDAYAARREQRRLAAQVFQRDQQQSVIELQEAFDHEQRQRDLALLEREGRIQRAQLVKGQLQQWLWAAGAAITLVLLGLAALLVRRVRAGNAQLAYANAQLSQLSERDALTGLANRRHFDAALQARGGKTALEGTLMLIDIDHFKQINDRYGHAVGDAVLVEVARRLRAALRDDDLLVRWGGEEFLVLVRAMQRAEVDTLVERLLLSVAALPVDCGAQQVPVSASIGFASFPLEPSLLQVAAEQAVDLVDTAMYLAKAHGRHRAYGLRHADAADAATLQTLALDLESAWRSGRVELSAIVGPAPQALAEAAS